MKPTQSTPSQRMYGPPAFDVRGILIWGFTTGVLNTLLDLCGSTRPWDQSIVRDLPLAVR